MLLWTGVPFIKLSKLPKAAPLLGFLMVLLHISAIGAVKLQAFGLDEHFRQPQDFQILSEQNEGSVYFIDSYQDASLFTWYTGRPSYNLIHPGRRASQYQLRDATLTTHFLAVNRQNMGRPIKGLQFWAAEVKDFQNWKDVNLHMSNDTVYAESLPHHIVPSEELILYGFDSSKRQVARLALGSATILRDGLAVAQVKRTIDEFLIASDGGLPADQKGGSGRTINWYLTVENRWIPTVLWWEVW